MTWNYRVVRFKNNEDIEEYYEIKEVFYDKQGNISGYTDSSVVSESFEGILDVLDLMRSATSKAVINEADFLKKESK
jgi:hypothetical protein